MAHAFFYQGLPDLNGTIVPDAVFDALMPVCSGAEFKVLCYIVRRTFGFKKKSDDISLKQMVDGITTKDGKVLDHGTGLSKSTTTDAVKGLVEKGIIIAVRNRSAERGDEPTTYRLKFANDPVSENPTRGGTKIGQGGVRKSNTQQTEIQTTEIQSRGSSSTATKNNKTNRTVSAGFTSLASLLPAANLPPHHTPSEESNPPWNWQDHLALKTAIEDISQKFGDSKNLPANLSQARHLFVAGHASEQHFVATLYEEYANVKSVTGVRNRMAYFFVCLRQRMGSGETVHKTSPVLSGPG